MIDITFPHEVTDMKDFYGRKAEIERVEPKFHQNQHTPVVIFGERRIGKTSLLNITIKRLQMIEERPFIPLIVERKGITSFKAFAQTILERLLASSPARAAQPAQIEGRYRLETIEQFASALASLLDPAGKMRYLLCVDEFDEIIRNAGSDSALIDGLIHHLIREDVGYYLRFLFSMTRIPDALQKSYSTPFTSIAEIVHLKPFTRVEMEEMVTGVLRGHVVFPKTEMDWLYQISGGHPYFAKLLLVCLLNRQPPRDTVVTAAHDLLQQALRDAVNHTGAESIVTNIYEIHFTDYEKRIMLFLADQRRPIPIKELHDISTLYVTAAKELVKRGYLDEYETGFDFHIAFLGHWLRNWSQFEEEKERLNIRRMLDPWAGSRAIVVEDETLKRYGLEDY